MQSNLALTLMDNADDIENLQSKENKEELMMRAGALLDSSLEIHPFFDAAVLNRGLLYLKENEYLKASHYFARALKIEPTNQKVKF